MILAIDTSTAACSAALFDSAGSCLAHRDELIGRGHAERLVPMIEELLDGRTAERILVGVGPGSFTGIRVGIAAAQGLAIGWDAELAGMSSLALLAAGANGGTVAAAMHGGHGELFVQQFEATRAIDAVAQPRPPRPRPLISAAAGGGARGPDLVEARGSGEAVEAWPSAANALNLPDGAAHPASPPDLCASSRCPRPGGRLMSTLPSAEAVRLVPGRSTDLPAVMAIMTTAFEAQFGEAWTRSQCAGILPMTGVSLMLAHDSGRRPPIGFSLFRTVAGEAELLLLAVAPDHQRNGIGRLLLEQFVDCARASGATRVHLEVRDGNPAVRNVSPGGVQAGRTAAQLLSRQRRAPIRRANPCPRLNCRP